MRRRSVFRSFDRFLRNRFMRAALSACALSLSSVALLPAQAVYAQDDDENTRVMWQVRYDASLSKSQKEEIQNTLLSTLARGRERHFAADSIIRQKLKTEGLQMPSCFEDGGPCASGSAFLLDVHQVDIYVDALFSWKNDEWFVDLKLYRRLSASSNPITQHGKKLSALLNNVVGSLFILESSVDITANVPDVEVYLNQKLLGTTPLSMKINEGEQKLTFKKEGYFPTTWEFTAKKGVIHSHDVVLQPETTPFTVNASDPEGKVIIDGEEWADVGQTKEILPGEHTVRVESEHYHPYEQSLMIYSGNPQTMTVSMLPNPRDVEDIRHDGIGRYRFSATGGYHFAFTKFSMEQLTSKIKKTGGESGHVLVSPGGYKGNARESWIDTSFHGLTLAFNYENEYWGLTLARLDLMGSAVDLDFGYYGTEDKGEKTKLFNANADGATLIGFYPAQIKAHYTFWVMQAEAVAGIGLSWIKLRSHALENIYASGVGYDGSKVDFSRTAFSANFDFALKYFFSEETFAMLSYGFQIDAEGHNDATFRHGMTIAFGMQIPLAMRDKVLYTELENVEINEDEQQILNDASSSIDPGDVVILQSEEDHDIQPAVIDVSDAVPLQELQPLDYGHPSTEDDAPIVLDDDDETVSYFMYTVPAEVFHG